MRGEMRRSKRGAGTWPTDIGWAGVRSGDGLLRRGYWDAGYDADDWVCVGDPGENMWHCHHLMSRVWAMIRYLHRGDVEKDRYTQGPGTPHIAGHKDIDPGQARQCQATIRLVPNVCVLRICGCLPVVCPPLTPGSTYAPPLHSDSWAQPSL